MNTSNNEIVKTVDFSLEKAIRFERGITSKGTTVRIEVTVNTFADDTCHVIVFADTLPRIISIPMIEYIAETSEIDFNYDVLKRLEPYFRKIELFLTVKSFSIDMDNHSFCGANIGVPESSYEDLVDEIIKQIEKR